MVPGTKILTTDLMDISTFLASLESSGIATGIRNSLYIFPLIESTHVLGLAMVFGTIAIIDLRLLGIASTRRSFRWMASDILKWTWAAFAVTAATGALMFITNAGVYYHNFFFRTKMLMLALAGINMLVFELTAGRSIHRWDKAPSAPLIGRTTAILSLVIWITIIFLGRWIGFTTTRATPAPPPEINFDNIFPGTPDGTTPATPPDNKR
jgi:hypothetical protein